MASPEQFFEIKPEPRIRMKRFVWVIKPVGDLEPGTFAETTKAFSETRKYIRRIGNTPRQEHIARRRLIPHGEGDFVEPEVRQVCWSGKVRYKDRFFEAGEIVYFIAHDGKEDILCFLDGDGMPVAFRAPHGQIAPVSKEVLEGERMAV